MKKDKTKKSQKDIILTQPTATQTVEEQNIPTLEDNQQIAIEDTCPIEENTQDTPEEVTQKAVFEEGDWGDRVTDFMATYPIAKNFAKMIGEEIVKDKALHNDKNCLEKALCRVFVKVYVEPQELAKDQKFLDAYILNDENIKKAIIDNYLDELQSKMPPKAMSSRGQMTITPPDRPKSIAQAGAVIKAMLTNRRI